MKKAVLLVFVFFLWLDFCYAGEKGLIAYWNFDREGDEAEDVSGNGFNGTINNCEFEKGIIGKALKFNGTGSYVEVQHDEKLMPEKFTISAWIKPVSFEAQDRGPIIVSKYGPPAYNGYLLLQEGTTGKPALHTADNQDMKGDRYRAIAPKPISTNEWHFIAGTFDGSKLCIYVDGVLKASAQGSFDIDENGVLVIGAQSWNKELGLFTGLIDEVKIYDRALSEKEIGEQYNAVVGGGGKQVQAKTEEKKKEEKKEVVKAEPPRIAKETGLVAYWSFDEGSGDTVKDSSGNDNDGTLVNGPVWIKGIKGNALSFEGTDDCVEIPHSDSLDLGAEGQSYSIEFWIKCTKANFEKYPDAHFFTKETFPYPFTITQYKDGKIDFRIYDGSSNPSVCSKESIMDGKWHFVVCMRDGKNKKLMMYIDGLLNIKGADRTAGNVNNQGSIKIGRSMGDDFSGAIDEAKIYNRLLTEDEIRAHYEALGGKLPEKKAEVSMGVKRAEGIPVTRKRLMEWKPVMDASGKPEAVREGETIKLRNNWMELVISDQTGEITSIAVKGKNVLDRPAGVIIRDVNAGKEFSMKDGSMSNFQLKTDMQGCAGVSFKKSFKDYTLIVRYTIDNQALCWDIELSTELSAREVNIDFSLPLLSKMEKAWWTSDNAPFELAALPVQKIIYRQNVVIPGISVYNSSQDFGFTFAGPFDLPKPGLSFAFYINKEGRPLVVSNFYLHTAKNEPARQALYIVPHEGDWRPGLAWMLKTYPSYFYPVAKHTIDGEGWYGMGDPGNKESEIKKMASQNVAWQEFHGHFPFYGLYVPDIEEWAIVMDQDKIGLDVWEKQVPTEGVLAQTRKNSYKNTRELIDLWHKYNIQVYLYFQSFEAWNPYAEKYFPDDIARDASGAPHGAWYYCRLMNPDPAFPWGKHIAAQIKKLTEVYPKVDGIFYDRDDYCNYDFSHDDGVTRMEDNPCYMLGFAQEQINKIIADTLHPLGMGIWTNGPTSIEVCREIDGIMSEAVGQAPYLQYLGIVRPLILLPYDRSPEQTEEKLRLALWTGHFPSITYGGGKSRKIEDKYRPLFSLLKNKKWVLYPHALTLPEGFKGNIYQSPAGDYLIAVVNPQKSQITSGVFSRDIPVKVRVPDAKEIKFCYLISADCMGVNKIDFSSRGEIIDISLPYHLVSSLVVLSKKPKFEIARTSLPVFTKGEKNRLLLNLQNMTDSKKSYNLLVSLPWQEKAESVVLACGESKAMSVEIFIPEEQEKGEIEFKVSLDGKEERMNARIVEAIQIEVPKIFVKSPAGEDIPVRIVNNTERELRMKLKGEMDDGGRVKILPGLSLEPFEEKEFVVNVAPAKEKAVLKISCEIARTDSPGESRSIEASFPVESAMLFSGSDLFNDNFSSGNMDKWNVIQGDWEVKDGAARGSGGGHFAITGDSSWQDYALQVTTKIEGSENPNITWLKSYVFFRVQDSTNFYRFGIHGDGNIIDLYKCENNNWISLGTYPFTPEKNRWYILKVEVKGKNIKGYIDGKLAIKAKDEAFTSGGIGIGVLEDAMVTYYKDVIVKKLD